MWKMWILTVVTLASPLSYADQTSDSGQDPIVISGTGFELKLSEVRKYLQDQLSGSGMEVTDVEVTWSLLGKIDLVFEDEDYVVKFNMLDGEKGTTYRVSCYLLASSDYGFGGLHASDCKSSPSAQFLFNYEELYRYTDVRRF